MHCSCYNLLLLVNSITITWILCHTNVHINTLVWQYFVHLVSFVQGICHAMICWIIYSNLELCQYCMNQCMYDVTVGNQELKTSGDYKIIYGHISIFLLKAWIKILRPCDITFLKQISLTRIFRLFLVTDEIAGILISHILIIWITKWNSIARLVLS